MITNILGAVLFSFYFVEVAGIPRAIKKGFKMFPHQRIKPFDCVTCLSVWSAVVLYFLPIQVSECFTIFFGAGYIGSKIK